GPIAPRGTVSTWYDATTPKVYSPAGLLHLHRPDFPHMVRCTPHSKNPQARPQVLIGGLPPCPGPRRPGPQRSPRGVPEASSSAGAAFCRRGKLWRPRRRGRVTPDKAVTFARFGLTGAWKPATDGIGAVCHSHTGRQPVYRSYSQARGSRRPLEKSRAR